MGVRRCLTDLRKKGGFITLGVVAALMVWPQLASSHHSFASVFTADGEEAIEVIEKHLKWHPDDPRAFYLGAGSLQQLGEHERAERWIGRALAIDPTDSVVLYNVACFYALEGQGDKALNCLESAVDHGSVSASWMQNDNDLETIRENPRFDALIERLQKQTQQ